MTTVFFRRVYLSLLCFFSIFSLLSLFLYYTWFIFLSGFPSSESMFLFFSLMSLIIFPCAHLLSFFTPHLPFSSSVMPSPSFSLLRLLCLYVSSLFQFWGSSCVELSSFVYSILLSLMVCFYVFSISSILYFISWFISSSLTLGLPLFVLYSLSLIISLWPSLFSLLHILSPSLWFSLSFCVLPLSLTCEAHPGSGSLISCG